MQSKHTKLGTVCSLLIVLSILVGCGSAGGVAPTEAPKETAPITQAAVTVPATGPVAGSTEASVIDEITARGKIRMAIFALEGAPNQRRNEDTGEIEGYFADVGRLLAKDLGVEPEFVDLEWKAIVPSVLSGQVDIIVAMPSATPKRALSMDFPACVVTYDSAAMMNKDGPIKTAADLKKPGVRIAVNMGTTHHMLAENQYPDAELIVYEAGTGAGALEISSGRADVGFTNVADIIEAMDEFPSIRPVRDENGEIAILAREPGCFAIRLGDPRFYNWLVNWTRWYKEHGILDAMFMKWAGPTLEKIKNLPK